MKIGIISRDSANYKSCFLSYEVDEDRKYLFYDCQVSRRMWVVVQSWVDRYDGGPGWSFYAFIFHSHQWKRKDGQVIVRVIWLSIIWNLWISKNGIMLQDGTFNFDSCFLSTKFLS